VVRSQILIRHFADSCPVVMPLLKRLAWMLIPCNTEKKKEKKLKKKKQIQNPQLLYKSNTKRHKKSLHLYNYHVR